jgi:hypothetical protein
LAVAEAFVDAFYSFDPDALAPFLESMPASEPYVSFYQGWAQGANYVIVDRQPCTVIDPSTAECQITVEDDLARALAIEAPITDLFLLTFDAEEIVAFEAPPPDIPVLDRAFAWVFENKPELFEPGASCERMFDGGSTPGECAVAFEVAFEEFISVSS